MFYSEKAHGLQNQRETRKPAAYVTGLGRKYSRGQALVHPVTPEKDYWWADTQADKAMLMTQMIQLTYTLFS